MIDSAITQAETRMKKSVQTLQDGFAKLRTGRAHPGLLDSVRVEYYQQQVPLSQVANVDDIIARQCLVRAKLLQFFIPARPAVFGIALAEAFHPEFGLVPFLESLGAR